MSLRSDHSLMVDLQKGDQEEGPTGSGVESDFAGFYQPRICSSLVTQATRAPRLQSTLAALTMQTAQETYSSGPVPGRVSHRSLDSFFRGV